MSEITKMLVAAGLLAAGFFGASLFGPPTKVQDASGAPNGWSQEALEPLEPLSANQQASAAESRATWDSSVTPAGHSDGNSFAARASGPFDQQQPSIPPAVPDLWKGPAALTPDQTAAAAAPSIRRQPPSDELAMLSPPALLPPDTGARSLRSSTFPTRPSMNANVDAGAFGRSPSARSDSFSAPFDNVPFTNAGPPTTDDWSGSTASLSPTPPRSASKPIWHVVADGDSLAKLAERYLGDAHRARDIYEANREAITSPDLLPIGVELRIPQTTAAASQFDVYDSAGTASGYTPQRRLTPLPDLPESTRLAPRARLQPPVSATLAGSGG